jgi:hypothetical protein
LGVLGGIAVTGGCGFAALACLALAVIVSVIIAAATTLIGASIGGTVGRYSVADDEDPTAPAGRRDDDDQCGRLSYRIRQSHHDGIRQNANAYWFIGYGVDDMGNVTDRRTPANPGMMKHGRSK